MEISALGTTTSNGRRRGKEAMREVIAGASVSVGTPRDIDTDSPLVRNPLELAGVEDEYVSYPGLMLEEDLLDHLADRESALTICGSGLTPEELPESEGLARDVLRFVLAHTKEHGEPPGPEVIAEEIGFCEFRPAKAPISYLIEKLRERHLKRQVMSVIREAGKMVATGAHPDETLQKLREGTSALESRAASRGTIRSAAETEYRPLTWLWEGWVPRGNLTLFAGEGGIGKSHFLIGLAARLSRGDGVNGEEPANTLILSAEDDFASITKPRLAAADADLERVYETFVLRQGVEMNPSFPDDQRFLLETIEKVNARLVIIDPGAAFWSISDSHNDNQIRRALGPLAKIAIQTGCAIIFLAHLNKGNGTFLQKINGSVGQSNAARSVLGMAVHPEEETHVVLCHAKVNYAQRQSSLVFELEECEVVIDGITVKTTRLRKIGVTGLTADDLVAPKQREKPRHDLARALIEEALADGPAPTADVKQRLDQEGISRGIFVEVKQELGVVSKQVDGVWTLTYEE